MRILVAGFLGAVAMFIWTSIAHTVTPLGEVGLSQISGEQAVMDTMRASMGDRSGLYFFPWMDAKDPNGMEKYQASVKANASGWIIYHPPGVSTDMAPMLAGEFVKEFVQSLIAAFLLSLAVVSGFGMRVAFVALIGVSASLATNASYLVWYGFPLDYTLAQMLIEVVAAVFAGVAIAFWFGRKAA